MLWYRPNGTFAYATCSLFQAENDDQVDAFLCAETRLAKADSSRALTPLDGGDGFYIATLKRVG